MTWEIRRTGTYYYRKERRNGRCVSVYVGGGAVAELISRFEATRQAARKNEREQLQQRLALLLTEDEEAELLSVAVETLAAATLCEAGFHCHKGTWRKRRMPKAKAVQPVRQPQAKPKPAAAPQPTLSHPKGPTAKQNALAIANAASRSEASPEDVEAFRQLIRREHSELWCKLYDPLKRESEKMIERFSKTPVVTESMRLRVEQMREQLASETDGPLEQSLIDNVILCWLRLGWAEQQYSAATAQAISVMEGEFWERRLTATQKRYVRACEALERVRKLLRPAKPQLNIDTINAALLAEHPVQVGCKLLAQALKDDLGQ